jgi:universal stress protein E
VKDLNNLLVIIDPDIEDDFVIERARLIATAYRPRVHLYINKPNAITPEKYATKSFTSRFFRTQEKLFSRHYRQRLKAIKQEFNALDIQVETEFSDERHTADSILNRIQQQQPDLVLKSVQRQSALARILITNTDWRLIKNSPAPVLLVKSRQWASDGSVMAAVDPLHAKAAQNQLDHLLLDTVSSLAQHLNLKKRVFHCYFPDLSAMFPKVIDAQEYIQEVKARHTVKIEELLKQHDMDMDDVILTRGDLVRTLQHCIQREKTNILVLGALSRNFVERAIVGSTAEKMLYDTSCDVLAMRNPTGPESQPAK